MKKKEKKNFDRSINNWLNNKNNIKKKSKLKINEDLKSLKLRKKSQPPLMLFQSLKNLKKKLTLHHMKARKRIANSQTLKERQIRLSKKMKTTKEEDGTMEERNMKGEEKEMKEEEEEEEEDVEVKEKVEIVNSKNLISQNTNQKTKKHLKMMEVIHHLYLPLLNHVNSREKK